MESVQLEWSHFQNNLVSSFKMLREESELYDVTLACDDDQVEAHKVILSASSSFFKNIIKRNPHPHPLLYLKGVKVENLKSLLDFMYLGKTKVAQDQVETFLLLGEDLGVKGLVKNKEKEVPEPAHISVESEYIVKEEGETQIFNDPRIATSVSEDIQKNTIETETSSPLNSTFELRKELENDLGLNESFDKNDQHVNMNDTFDKIENSFNKTFEHPKVVTEDQDQFFDDMNLTHTTESEADAQVASFMDKTVDVDNRTVWKCTECNKVSKTKANLKLHVEIHMTGLSFLCKYCDKVCKTRNSLNFHMYTNKQCKEKKYSKV